MWCYHQLKKHECFGGSTSREHCPGYSACCHISPQVSLAVDNRVEQVRRSPSLWLPESPVPGGEAGRSLAWRSSEWQPHTGDEPGTMEEPWTRLWRLVAPVQRRGRLHWGSREAALWLCGSAGQAHVQPRTTGWEKCPQLMSTETWQLACKSFGLGPSVPCSYKTCCHGPSARLAGVLRQDKHPEQGAHTSPGITACLLRQSRENNYFSKEHCVITTLSIISS